MKKSILIVEDDELLADVFAGSLKSQGFKVRVAKDYRDAMKKFLPGSTALVVLDIILKGKNGFELLRDFRKEPGGDQVPIVIVTGLNTQELNMDKDLRVSLNIIGIHTKSQFSIGQFTGIIRNYLARYETDRI